MCNETDSDTPDKYQGQPMKITGGVRVSTKERLLKRRHVLLDELERVNSVLNLLTPEIENTLVVTELLNNLRVL